MARAAERGGSPVLSKFVTDGGLSVSLQVSAAPPGGVSAQKIDGQWMLKQMRVETLDPQTRKILNRTYLEVLGKTETDPPSR